MRLLDIDWLGMALAVLLLAWAFFGFADGRARLDCWQGIQPACDTLAARYKEPAK